MLVFLVMSKKRLLSGIKSTGTLHLGNYLAAMEQMVSLQDEYESYIFVADYHALNQVQNAEEMRSLSRDIVLSYLAVGLDPQKVTLFRQSSVPAHTELCWIFNTITTMPYLMRAHAFKDAEAKNKDISVGTFDYPMLMAADILLYEPSIVPVGGDQKQHVEFARDTAEKFNRIFGEAFTLPEARIVEALATIPGTDGRKMGKSDNNIIPLFAEESEIEKAVMSIVTDSKAVEEPKGTKGDTLYELHTHFSKEELPDITERYQKGGIGYKESKDILKKNLSTFIAPLRERKKELEKDPEFVDGVLTEGAKRAGERAEQKMKQVRSLIGIV